MSESADFRKSENPDFQNSGASDVEFSVASDARHRRCADPSKKHGDWKCTMGGSSMGNGMLLGSPCFFDGSGPIRCLASDAPENSTSDAPEIGKSGFSDFRKSGFSEIRKSGNLKIRIFGFPEIRIFGNRISEISGKKRKSGITSNYAQHQILCRPNITYPNYPQCWVAWTL